MVMAAQRPKRNNSPINSKHQPLKATVPFQSLLRNPSPTRRRTSPSSPVLPPDKRNHRLKRSPDILGNEHRALISPLGSKVAICKPVYKAKVEKHIRRTNSLETLSTSYINGQWPRENSVINVNIVTGNNKGTQTPGSWEDPATDEILHYSLDQRKSSSIGGAAGSKEIFRQCLQRTKQQSAQPFLGKQSRIHGDHSAVCLSYISSKPVSIPQVPLSPKYPSLHTRRSVEGLNFELEGLELEAKEIDTSARTPPEGRRPPVPGITAKNVDMHTQTSNGWIDTSFSPTSIHQKRSVSVSPSWPSPEKKNISPNRSLSADSTTPGMGSPDGPTSLVPKYAASPKPNNSFWFARGPPDGAEKIPLSIEDIESDASIECSSCPDTSKVTIQFSKDSPFCSYSADNLVKGKTLP